MDNIRMTRNKPNPIPEGGELLRGERLELSYLYGSTVRYQPGEVLGPRILTDYEAILVIEGGATYETPEGQQRMEPGAMVLAQPGANEIYRWDTGEQTRHAYFHFDLACIPDDWPDPADWPHYQPAPDPVVTGLFRHIVERAARHNDWPARRPGPSDNRIFAAFLDLFLHQGRAMPRPVAGERSEPVRRALKFMREVIDENPRRPVSLEDLAGAAHVSTKHLCRAFRIDLAIPPMKTYRLMQLQLAIALLARSNLSIQEIAVRCGFDDPLYFSRSFARAFGQSPSKTRKKLLAGERPPPSPLPAEVMPRVYW